MVFAVSHVKMSISRDAARSTRARSAGVPALRSGSARARVRAFDAWLASHSSRVASLAASSPCAIGKSQQRAEALEVGPVVSVGHERLVGLRHRARVDAQRPRRGLQARGAVGHGNVAQPGQELVALGRRQVSAQPVGQTGHVPRDRPSGALLGPAEVLDVAAIGRPREPPRDDDAEERQAGDGHDGQGPRLARHVRDYSRR